MVGIGPVPYQQGHAHTHTMPSTNQEANMAEALRAQSAVPPDLARWSLHCFCPKASRNPKRIVELDNNGQLLFGAVGGKTQAEIEADGIPISESQLVLLETFGLVERRDNYITTRILVLLPEAISAIRHAAATAARHAVAGVSEAAEDIVATLASRGLESSAYAVVFGHALDGVLWDSLRQRGFLPEIELTVAEPFWKGALWAVYPGRAGASGTNELSIGHNHLVMVWDDASAESLRDLASHPDSQTLLKSASRDTQRVSLASIFDDEFEIPVISKQDEIQSKSVDLAEQVADVMPDGEGCRVLLADSGVVTSAEEAAVIVAHELIWEMAEMLEEADVVPFPVAGDPSHRVFVRVDH
jgi:hypothetical protein